MFFLILAVLFIVALVFNIKWLKKILGIVLLVMALWFTCGMTLAVPAFSAFGFASAGFTLGGTAAAIAAAGTAFLAFPDETAETVGAAAEAAGTAAKSVVNSIGDVASTAASNILSNPLVLAGIGFGIWWFFFRDKNEARDEGGGAAGGSQDATSTSAGSPDVRAPQGAPGPSTATPAFQGAAT